MRLIIVSGMSGSGKSTVLNVLEDLGLYCVDNLPIALLGSFVQEMLDRDVIAANGVAVGIDARSPAEDLRQFGDHMKAARIPKVSCELLFLDADDEVLLQRFSETRRKHPLSDDRTPLSDAISLERQMLESFSATADWRLDTTRTNPHQLKDQISQRLVGNDEAGLLLLFESFGFKHGHPNDADFVFDLRCLPNPHWVEGLRSLTGRDQPVIEFLQRAADVDAMYSDISGFLQRWIPRFEAENRRYLTIGIGCTGGQHRSVYMAERLQQRFDQLGLRVQVRHRELQ